MHRLLLDIRQDIVDPSARLTPVVPPVGVAGPGISPAIGRITPRGVLVVQATQGELLQIVLALHLPGRLAGRLHRRQQKRDQDGDDRDHHQEFHQGETGYCILNSCSPVRHHTVLTVTDRKKSVARRILDGVWNRRPIRHPPSNIRSNFSRRGGSGTATPTLCPPLGRQINCRSAKRSLSRRERVRVA